MPNFDWWMETDIYECWLRRQTDGHFHGQMAVLRYRYRYYLQTCSSTRTLHVVHIRFGDAKIETNMS